MHPYCPDFFRKALFIFSCAIFLSGAFSAETQAQAVNDVPPDKPNSRFMDDSVFHTMRPGLTFAGFSGETRNALGLKEILNRAAEFPGDPVHDTLSRILTLSKQPHPHDPPFHQIEYTSNILQYLAFETLAALILEQNGISSHQTENLYSLPFRSHDTLMPLLSSALTFLSENDKLVPKLPGDQPFDDYLDALRSYNNIARTVDLYLGIENAYAYYDLDESPLLTRSEKMLLMERFAADLHILYHDGIKQVYSFADGGITVHADELEAGNRPLKAYLALGYVSLSLQSESDSEKEQFEEYISMAIEKASKPVQPHHRGNYWMYQSGNGQPFWAEGPYYFDFALKDAITFWHAVREIQTLPLPTDPFSNSWFLNPVTWLASLSTPDGAVPPLDDGNKRSIQSALLLRWAPGYGDPQIGESFATIYDNIRKYPTPGNEEDQFLLVEAAIPRVQNAGTSIPSHTSPGGQQLITRYTEPEGGEHYILLNGEHGQAITAGEGHEQPDQLQLLYYRDQHSYLVDPGYDRGFTQTNSSWNGYVHTNTMQYNASDIRRTLDFVTTQNEGGLRSPHVSQTEIRKVSNHNPATLQHHHPASEVEILSGTVQLEFDLPEHSQAAYQRQVFFIKGDQPYLIDINDVTSEKGRSDFVMRYHGYSPKSSTDNGWFYWHPAEINASQPGHNLYLYALPMIGNYSVQDSTVYIQEVENRNASGHKEPYPVIQKSLVYNEESDRFVTAGYFQIGNTAPQHVPQLFRESAQISYLWKQMDPFTYDLFLFTADSKETSRTIDIASGPAAGLRFELAPGQTTGFTRLIMTDNEWRQDEGFSAYLTKLTETGDNTEVIAQFLTPYPNPSGQSVTFQYLLKEDSVITINVYDLLGRRIQTLLKTNKSAGSHELTWRPDSLSSSVYMVRFTAVSARGTTYQAVRKVSVLN